jgi:hypothetical protein
MFQRVVLYGKAGSRMHSYFQEAGFPRLWWIQGMISATLISVGVDKTTTPRVGLEQLNISFLYPNNIP